MVKVFFCETYDDGTVGGSHACMYNLIKHMDRSRVSFTAGFYSENIFAQRCRDLGVGVEILPFGRPLRSGNAMVRKAVNWYREEFKAGRFIEEFFLRNGFDLVVLNNSIVPSLLFVRVCNRLKVPVIVYERGIGCYDDVHIRATADIQASIPISDAVHKVLLKYGFRTKVIERIYDGIAPEGLSSTRNAAKTKRSLNIPEEARVIGIIGNVRPWKGQKHFVDAFIRLTDTRKDVYGLVIGGWAEADAQFQASLSKRVADSGLSGRLSFLGYRNDVPELLSALDVFVHASTKPEPFGMVILEAMAAGKPVVATNHGGPVEILDNGSCGTLVPPADSEAIVAACVKYLDDTEFSAAMVERAKRRLESDFDIATTVERTAELYERVCNSWKASSFTSAV